MPDEQKKKIAYIVACIDAYARRHNIHPSEACLYLYQHGGITFLVDYYEIEHTLSFEDAVDDLERICASEGGTSV